MRNIMDRCATYATHNEGGEECNKDQDNKGSHCPASDKSEKGTGRDARLTDDNVRQVEDVPPYREAESGENRRACTR